MVGFTGDSIIASRCYWATRSVTTEKWSYGYDAAQNLTKRTNYTTVETFTVNALNQLVTVPDGAVQYDRRGNLVTRTFGGSQAYRTWTWDHENRLTRVQTDDYYTPEASRWRVDFTYDGSGRLRIRKDYVWYSGYGWYPAGETRYLYDGLLPVQERNSANTPLVTYTRGRDLSGRLDGAGGIGGLLARSHGYSGGNWSSHNAYHADGNGNVTALVNRSGVLQASYRYDPYGRYLAADGPLTTANMMRFSSKPWVGHNGSATDGLYYYGYRYYDPYLQRWPNCDPLGEPGFETLRRLSSPIKRYKVIPNLYQFVDNNPITETDYLGLDNSRLHRGRCCNKSKGDEWALVSTGEGANEKTDWKKLKPGECVGGFFSDSDCEGMTCGGGFYVVKPYDLTGTCKTPGCDSWPYTHRRWQPDGGGDKGAQSPTDRGGPSNTPPGYEYGPRPR